MGSFSESQNGYRRNGGGVSRFFFYELVILRAMGTKTLVVDDSLVVAKQLTSLLNEDGRFEVIGHAKDGAEALTMVANAQPRLVVLDMVMPTMDGIQALRAIRRMDASIRVVVLSTVGGEAERAEEAMRIGASAVVAKPYDPQELLGVLAKAVEEEASA